MSTLVQFCYILQSQVSTNDDNNSCCKFIITTENEWVNKEKNMCLYVMCVTSDIILVTTNFVIAALELHFILLLFAWCNLWKKCNATLCLALWKGYNKNTHHYIIIIILKQSIHNRHTTANIIFIIYHQIKSHHFNRQFYIACWGCRGRVLVWLCGNKKKAV